MFTRFSLCFLAVVVAVVLPFGNKDDKEEKKQIKAFLLSGIKENRDRLRKGVFHVRGSISNSNKERGSGKISIFCAFDNDAKFFRFDRQEPAFYTFPKEGNRREVGIGGGKAIRTSELVVNAPIGSQGVISGVLFEKPEAAINQGIKPFDIRAVGLDLAANWKSGDTFEQIMKYFQNETSVEEAVVEEGNSLYRWDRIYSLSNNQVSKLKLILWIDGRNGFCARRFESRELRQDSGQEKWSDPTQFTEVTWKQINTVWVPTTVRIVEGAVPQNISTIEYAFEWESVNTTPDPKLFTEEGLGLKPGSYTLLDYRFGVPIMLKKEGQIGPTTSKLIVTRRSDPWTAYWPYFVGPLIACVPIAFVYWWYRRWKYNQLIRS